MRNLRTTIQVSFGLAALAAACSEKPKSPTREETVATPASQRTGGETSTAQAPSTLPAASALPSVPPSNDDPCAGVDCGDGYCDLKTVQCVRAPCPPVGTCVNGTHPCAAMTCAAGSRCESHDGQGVCVPPVGDGAACGTVTCGGGQVCCNASCGICTDPGGACTQQACE